MQSLITLGNKTSQVPKQHRRIPDTGSVFQPGMHHLATAHKSSISLQYNMSVVKCKYTMALLPATPYRTHRTHRTHTIQDTQYTVELWLVSCATHALKATFFSYKLCFECTCNTQYLPSSVPATTVKPSCKIVAVEILDSHLNDLMYLCYTQTHTHTHTQYSN